MLEYIDQLKEHNRKYLKDSKSYANLSRLEHDYKKIKKAEKISPAVGVFGPSQCGKSFLVSELSGGSNIRLNIKGLEDKNFMDYNSSHQNRETTAVVTRFTKDEYSSLAPSKHILTRLLSPADIMRSLVKGFYHDIKYQEFTISEDDKVFKKQKIQENSSAQNFLSQENTVDLFNDFFTLIEDLRKSEGNSFDDSMPRYASEYYALNPDKNYSLDQITEMISTLWMGDKYFSNAFRVMMQSLKKLKFEEEVYIPENQLKNILDVETREAIRLVFSPDMLPDIEQGVLVYSDNEDAAVQQSGNLQALVKEVVLSIESNSDIVKGLDILDFPGARSATDNSTRPGPNEVEQEISNNQSTIISEAYKRGRLLHLFDLYCKTYEIPLLLFCSENGNQEASVIKALLQHWVERYNTGSDNLFAVFTKSDNLIGDGNEEQKEKLLEGRFYTHFEKYYGGGWVNDWDNEGNPFQNIYCVRNPSIEHSPFRKSTGNESEEVFREGFKEKRDVLYNAWSKNKYVEKFLGNKKEDVFKSVFEPNFDGTKRLVNALIEKHNSDPDIKKRALVKNLENIVSEILSYISKHIPHEEGEVEENLRREALKFVESIREEKSLSFLINNISEKFPADEVFEDIVKEYRDEAQNNTNQIFSTSPLLLALDEYVQRWIRSCKPELKSELKNTPSGDLNNYLDNLAKYLSSDEVMKELKEDLPHFFPDRPSDARELNKYIKWICCDHLCHLGLRDSSRIDTGPIKVDSINFEDKILDKWREMLPEIYLGHYNPPQPSEGDNDLKNIKDRIIEEYSNV